MLLSITTIKFRLINLPSLLKYASKIGSNTELVLFPSFMSSKRELLYLVSIMFHGQGKCLTWFKWMSPKYLNPEGGIGNSLLMIAKDCMCKGQTVWNIKMIHGLRLAFYSSTFKSLFYSK